MALLSFRNLGRVITLGASNLLTFLGGLTLGGDLTIPNANKIASTSFGSMKFIADGVVQFINNAGTGFTRIVLGAASASGVALQLTGSNTLDVVNGDNGNWSQVRAQSFAAQTGAVTAITFLKSGTIAVASLPAAATAGAGARYVVTDANSTTFMSTVAAGGANIVPVFSDGTNWKIG